VTAGTQNVIAFAALEKYGGLAFTHDKLGARFDIGRTPFGPPVHHIVAVHINPLDNFHN
jgi:hypothetical protein